MERVAAMSLVEWLHTASRAGLCSLTAWKLPWPPGSL